MILSPVSKSCRLREDKAQGLIDADARGRQWSGRQRALTERVGCGPLRPNIRVLGWTISMALAKVGRKWGEVGSGNGFWQIFLFVIARATCLEKWGAYAGFTYVLQIIEKFKLTKIVLLSPTRKNSVPRYSKNCCQ